MTEHDANAMFAKWVELAPSPKEVPFLTSLWGPPIYAQETLNRPNQPFYDEYDALYDEIGDTLTVTDEGNWYVPDAEFWTPTPAMQEKLDRLNHLAGLSYHRVPNPDYDPVKAAEWEAEAKRPYVFSKVIKIGDHGD